MTEDLVIIGASGHGKVIADIALKQGHHIRGFLDDNSSLHEVCGFPVLGRVDQIKAMQDDCTFVIAIGDNHVRKKFAQRYPVRWQTLVHPSAIIGMDVQIGAGTVVMANAVINPGATIGAHCIINTGAIVDHDNRLEDYVHISPGVVLAGTVSVGNGSHLGAGACVRNNISIGADVVLGAGAVVVNDLTTPGTYVGVPAKKIK